MEANMLFERRNNAKPQKNEAAPNSKVANALQPCNLATLKSEQSDMSFKLNKKDLQPDKHPIGGHIVMTGNLVFLTVIAQLCQNIIEFLYARSSQGKWRRYLLALLT